MYKKKSMSSFNVFGFSNEILDAIKATGYLKPTNIQEVAIPKILAGRDVLAGAETGSGKTAAFVLPVLHVLTRTASHAQYGQIKETAKAHQVRALILVPTRELAIQIGQEVRKFAKNIDPWVTCLSVYGGVKIEQSVKELRVGTDFLVATPSRFLDLIKAKAVKFNQLEMLILDEVDRLVSGGFKEEVEQIIKYLPNKRQNLFFTATFPNEIRPLVREVLDNPEIIQQEPEGKQLIEQRVLTVNLDRKTALLIHLLENNDWSQVLIFCSAKRSCDQLVKKLVEKEIEAFALHGDKKQHERRDVLKEFKAGAIRLIIATDVAARGLDIVQLPCVINYDLPRSPNDYVHRIGRTGRAGEEGMAISLISHHEYQHFNVIEKRNGLQLSWEEIVGFEADEIAPPAPRRSGPKKKKSKKRPTKKQRNRNKKEDVSKIEEQQVETPTEKSVSPYKKPLETSTEKSVSPYKKPLKPSSKESPDTSRQKEKPIPIPSKKTDDEVNAPGVNESIWGRK
jgi:superfamily II DNA/RNA helicase